MAKAKKPAKAKADKPKIGFDVTVTPIKKTLKSREDAKAKDRAALEKRVKARGGVVGEAQ